MSPSLHLASRPVGEIFRLSALPIFFHPIRMVEICPQVLPFSLIFVSEKIIFVPGILADGSTKYSLNVASLYTIPEFLFTSL
jgi:hypothetical protein